jgi:hypothetical protein
VLHEHAAANAELFSSVQKKTCPALIPRPLNALHWLNSRHRLQFLSLEVAGRDRNRHTQAHPAHQPEQTSVLPSCLELFFSLRAINVDRKEAQCPEGNTRTFKRPLPVILTSPAKLISFQKETKLPPCKVEFCSGTRRPGSA